MNWKRIVGYGVVLWLVPFAVAFVLFGVREANRALFESLITVIGVGCAVAASLLFFRAEKSVSAATGIAIGFAWAAISIVIDLPIFLAVFRMPLADYAADIALTYLAFPMIVGGISAAMHVAPAVS
jgi:hypothetical protein